jgi:prepilin-type N-terminal cleavage/methylation domain-containing protein
MGKRLCFKTKHAIMHSYKLIFLQTKGYIKMVGTFKSKRQEGFTIIEVLIVLAIAGLIMLVVFLAVPALQRNAHNSTRNAEAARYAAAVSTCLANRNGVVASCQATGVSAVDVGTITNNEISSIAISASTVATQPTPTLTAAQVWYGAVCAADGSSASQPAGTSTRSFAVLYMIETSGAGAVKCISS